ncbi:MAG: adenylate/guanylate cyclase domain-containing protein [Spartobacteria bacterium]
MASTDEQAEKWNAAIAGLEAQRGTLGDAVVDSALAALRTQLSQLRTGASEQMAGDERKLVTILFADVSGFTALSESLDPEEVRRLINACFDHLVPIVRKYDGTIDKFIGDEIMALFGAPIAHEDDPERALRAALEMMEAMGAFNQIHGTNLGMHLGINTGRVIAGSVGAEGRRDYSVMGDAVNLAARLEDASVTGEIFVGPNTCRATAKLFDFEALPPLNLKGKEEPVQVHRLIGLKAMPARGRGIEGLQAPLVGREVELARIREALAHLHDGRGGALSILGEAGLGKSRLLEEARKLAGDKTRWAEGRALSYTAGQSYWLVRELIFNLLGINADAAPVVMAEALRANLQPLFGEKLDEIFPYLARLLELPLDERMEERVKFLSSEALQSRILQSVRDYVRACAMQNPLVLVCEDLHWGDPSSLQTIEQMIPLIREVPLLLLFAARTEESRGLKFLDEMDERYAEHWRRIELRPLDSAQSDALAGALLKIDNLSEKMRKLIVARAEGNPFFIEELLRSLLDAGVISLDEEGARLVREVQAVDVPDTLQEVLSARIDRLLPENKRALQKAAVIGRVFQRTVLARLHENDGSAGGGLARSLEELQRRAFIQSREQNASETASLHEDEYIFKHAITHDVAYESLLRATRKELHGLTARALEQLFPSRLDELAATLGYHFERAEASADAAKYLGKAAERAQRTFANTEAVDLYRAAIAQWERMDSAKEKMSIQAAAAQLYEGLGDVLTLMGAHDEARVAFAGGRSHAPNDERILRSRLFRKTGSSHSLQRHYEESQTGYDAADGELGAAPTHQVDEWWEEKVQIQLERMHLLYWQGLAEEMRALGQQYRVAVTERGTPIQRGKFFLMQALSLLSASRYHPSAECLELAKLAISESEGSANLSETAHVRFTLGLINLWRGNFDDAVQHGEAALDLARRVGDAVIQARCLTYLAVAHRRARDVDLARKYAVDTVELATKIGMVEYVAMAKANLAWVAWREEKLAEAETLGRAALELWHGMEDPYSLDWLAVWPLIATALKRGDISGAISDARTLLDEEQYPLPDKVTALLRQAIVHWEKKQSDSARADLQSALEAAHQIAQV